MAALVRGIFDHYPDNAAGVAANERPATREEIASWPESRVREELLRASDAMLAGVPYPQNLEAILLRAAHLIAESGQTVGIIYPRRDGLRSLTLINTFISLLQPDSSMPGN